MCRVGQVGDFDEELMKSVGGNFQLESNLGEHGNPAEDIDGDNQSSCQQQRGWYGAQDRAPEAVKIGFSQHPRQGKDMSDHILAVTPAKRLVYGDAPL